MVARAVAPAVPADGGLRWLSLFIGVALFDGPFPTSSPAGLIRGRGDHVTTYRNVARRVAQAATFLDERRAFASV